jgi:hypothetical protein
VLSLTKLTSVKGSLSPRTVNIEALEPSIGLRLALLIVWVDSSWPGPMCQCVRDMNPFNTSCFVLLVRRRGVITSYQSCEGGVYDAHLEGLGYRAARATGDRKSKISTYYLRYR